MRSSNDLRIRARVAAAKQAAEQGRTAEAGQLLRQIESEAPQHPLILSEKAAQLLKSGKPAAARVLIEQALRAESSDPEIWFTLAATSRALGQLDEAATALDRLLAIDPANLSALLEKGSLEEQQGRKRMAAKSYLSALLNRPPGLQPPPWMEKSLQHAREVVESNNRELETHIDRHLEAIKARYADEPLHRLDQCIDTILYKRRIFRQQPTFMYFPELPAVEFYDRADFPWLDSVEAAADDMREELLAILSEGASAVEPYVDASASATGELRALRNSRRWSAYHFWREGKAFPDHIARCPRTVAALESVPRWEVPHSGPNAMFSVLDAKTRIPAHTGPVNTRLVVHLPLIVPPSCGFRVGGQTREWQAGKAFVFDDSINHEAWNDGTETRAVLIFDIWSPFLTGAERALISALTDSIHEYYEPPPGDGRM